MTFKQAVAMTPHLEGAWISGTGALRSIDRPRVQIDDPRLFQGSAAIDDALRSHLPNARRWDYAIGVRHSNRKDDFIYWVEVHPATGKEIKIVLDKLHWLLTWLADDGIRLGQFKRDFVWISSGRTSFTPGSPQSKQLASKGLRHCGRILKIRDER